MQALAAKLRTDRVVAFIFSVGACVVLGVTFSCSVSKKRTPDGVKLQDHEGGAWKPMRDDPV